ncbi:MAG: tetratricopeptide repeat protein [Planctomycetaceae bacterium]|nr:tetratricopeptide repeat protein [Planctomycetaceae bacterium]
MPNNTAKTPKAGPPQFLLDAISAINKGCHDQAIEIFKKNIEHNRFVAYCGIGDVYRAKCEYEEALKWLQKAYDYNPDAPNIIDSMAKVLKKLNRTDEAATIMCKALKRQKDAAGIRAVLDTMRKQGHSEKAAEVLEELIKENPTKLDYVFELGVFFEGIREFEKAEKNYEKIVKIIPHVHTYDRLGWICVKTDRMSQAASHFRKGLQIEPNNEKLKSGLATALMKSGEIQEGSQLLQAAINKAQIDDKTHSTYLYHLHLLPDAELQTISDAHKQWGAKHTPPSMANMNHTNDPDPNRKLRIGYLSPDFKRHPVGAIFEVLINAHNRDIMQIFGYGNVEQPDDLTVKLREKFDCYRDVFKVNDDSLARLIRDDKIDILVDLAGHTAGHRLIMMARKPAPVQVTYLGYFDTTGMSQMDYIITDELLNPPETQKYYTEKFAYLPGGVCFYTHRTEYEILPPPSVKNGYITFGVFSNNMRFNDLLFKTWAQIVKSVPNSKLFIGFTAGDDKAIQESYFKKFEDFGVSRQRIRFSGRKLYNEYIKQYSDVDITFDTFPENGGTTTGDAMWMGCPVISKYGSHMNGRVGLTILNRLDMGEYAVPTREEYIAKAVELAQNPAKLAELRTSLRQKMKNSPLFDAKRMAQEVEAAYRQMWKNWCDARI